MVVITVQVGQCGNQLGSTVFDALSSSSQSPLPSDYFREPSSSRSSSSFSDPSDPATQHQQQQIARAVLIDTEPKVVSRCLAPTSPSDKRWRYSKNNAMILAQGGAANNWACGFQIARGKQEEDVLEKIRKESEHADSVSALHVLHSLAGGTGSGLGSALTLTLRDSFSSSCLIVNTVVSPFHTGEVIVQDYNAALTLASLSDGSDAIFSFSNESSALACKKLLKNPRPSIPDLNVVIGGTVASALLPSSATRDESSGLYSLSDAVLHLCPHPGLKVVQCKRVPLMPSSSVDFTSDSWNGGVVGRLRQMQRCGAALDCDVNWRVKKDINVQVATLLILRGTGGGGGGGTTTTTTTTNGHNGDDVWSADVEPFFKEVRSAAWNDEPVKVWRSDVDFGAVDKCGVLLTNGQECLDMLGRVSRARDKFEVGAYVHQYEKFGVGKAEFEEAFIAIDQIACNYKTLECVD